MADKNQKTVTCAICGSDGMTDAYPYPVCGTCDDKAVNGTGAKAWDGYIEPEEGSTVIREGGSGDNPVFIDGIKCWRRYRFGGYITMRDPEDCATLREFMDRVFKPFKGIRM